MEKEYLIIGSNNFWYAACLKNMAEVREDIKLIKEGNEEYADPESGHIPNTPELLYVYRAVKIKEIEL